MTQAERDRLAALKKAKKKLITQRQAAEELGITERHLVADAPWNEEGLLDRALDTVLGSILRQYPVLAWVVDDTGFPQTGQALANASACLALSIIRCPAVGFFALISAIFTMRQPKRR
jgi:SRSO17 transposase